MLYLCLHQIKPCCRLDTQAYWTEKELAARKIVIEFPGKRWKMMSMHRLINEVKQPGTIEKKTGIDIICEEMIVSHEECLEAHKS